MASIQFGTSTTGSTTPVITLNNSQNGTISLTGATGITAASKQTNKVTLSSNLSLAPSTGSSTTFNITQATTVGGAIGDNFAATGVPVGLIKTGSAALTLNTANTYTGQTSILQNSIVLNGAATLGTSTLPVLVGDVSGTSTASLFSSGTNTLANNVIVQSGSSGTVTLGSNGTGTTLTAVWNGSVSLNKDTTFENLNPNNRLVTLNGGIADGSSNFISSNVTIIGPGRTIISGGNAAYSGNTTISSGTLELDSALSSSPATVTVQSNAALTGTGAVNRSVTVNPGGSIYGGTGSAIGTTLSLAPGTLTITGGNTLSLQNGATLGFVLPAASAGSSTGIVADTLSVDSNDASRNVLVNIFDNGTLPDNGTYVRSRVEHVRSLICHRMELFANFGVHGKSGVVRDLGDGAGGNCRA